MNRRTRNLTSIAIALGALFAAAAAPAAVATLGGLGSATVFSASDSTYVDLVRSATADGSYSSATVYWGGGSGSCGSFLLKFYRPDAATGEHLTYLDERGPFAAHSGLVDVTLSPAVSLHAGDLVGITELSPGECGAVEMITGGGLQTLQFVGDSGTASISICDQELARILPQTMGVLVRGSGTLNRAGIVLGAGSVQGAAGSNFKTSMQLVNPGNQTIACQLVFHPAGRPASDGDPVRAVVIGPNQDVGFPDIVAAIGGSGLGSIDVLASSSYAPLVVTRIFNDGGAAGTAGFSEPMVRPNDEYVINTGDSAVLVMPNDFSEFRMNIAVRALSNGASLTFNLIDSNGTFLASSTKTYGADEFDLDAASAIFPGVNFGINDTVVAQVTAGRAIIGGVVVDNKTNDTSLQLGTRTHF